MLGGMQSVNSSNSLSEAEKSLMSKMATLVGEEITNQARAMNLPTAKIHGTTPSNVIAVMDSQRLYLVFERTNNPMVTFLMRDMRGHKVTVEDIAAFGGQEIGMTSPASVAFDLSVVNGDDGAKRAAAKHVAADLLAQAKVMLNKPRTLAGFEGLQPLLDAFSTDHPNFDKNVFVAMRFADTEQNKAIWQAIDDTLKRYGMKAQRADAKSYPQDDDLWNNVCVYMMGCKFGICVFDQIDQRDFNPNVQIEYGFMRASDKRVLLLKDMRQPSMPVDITGKIRREFDTYKIPETVSARVSEWLEKDLGLKPAP